MISQHGEINRQDYLEVLSNQVHPMVQVTVPEGHTIFQDNNAPLYTARIVKECHEEHSDVEHHVWPPQYPNLNIIEHLWSVLQQKAGNHPPSSLRTRRGFDKKIW